MALLRTVESKAYDAVMAMVVAQEHLQLNQSTVEFFCGKLYNAAYGGGWKLNKKHLHGRCPLYIVPLYLPLFCSEIKSEKMREEPSFIHYGLAISSRCIM